METLLNDKELRTRLSKQARTTAKKYSIENSIRDTLKIYRRLARGVG
jgi:glycosyltransferase involved in cell wall biosynthesis